MAHRAYLQSFSPRGAGRGLEDGGGGCLEETAGPQAFQLESQVRRRNRPRGYFPRTQCTCCAARAQRPCPTQASHKRSPHSLPPLRLFSHARREDSYDEDLSPEQIAALSEQERLLHQEAAGKAAAARLKAAKKAERERKAAGGGGASSSSSASAAAGGGGGGAEEEEDEEDEEDDDDEEYGGAAGARKRKPATEGRGGSPAGEKRTKVVSGTVSSGRRGKEPEDIYTKLLKEKRAAELKVSAQEAHSARALADLNELCEKDANVAKVLKAMRDQIVPKSMGAKEGIDAINSIIVALQVRSTRPAGAICAHCPCSLPLCYTHTCLPAVSQAWGKYKATTIGLDEARALHDAADSAYDAAMAEKTAALGASSLGASAW